MSDIKDQVQEGLDAARQQLEELRVKANLLKMELRDKHGDVVDDIEKAYEATKEKLVEFGDATEETADDAAQSLKSAWKTLKQKIHEATAPDA
jgi:hypothetical protein